MKTPSSQKKSEVKTSYTQKKFEVRITSSQKGLSGKRNGIKEQQPESFKILSAHTSDRVTRHRIGTQVRFLDCEQNRTLDSLSVSYREDQKCVIALVMINDLPRIVLNIGVTS